MKTKFTITILLCILMYTLAIQNCKAQYVEDFEGVNNGWTISAANANSSLWELGLPNFGATTGAHSGTHAWDVSLDSAYQNSSYTILTSPVFDFSSAVNATLTFWRNNNCEANWDGTRMEYSTNGGV